MIKKGINRESMQCYDQSEITVSVEETFAISQIKNNNIANSKCYIE